MMNFWTAAFLFALLAEIILVPCYLFAPFFKGGRRPLVAKCVCAALFILIGVFAMIASSNYRAFAYLMLGGLFFSSFGDYFLGVAMKGKNFIFGVLSFTVAHLLYSLAFVSALAAENPARPFVNRNEMVSFVVLLALLAVSSFVLKLDMGKLTGLIFIYACVILAMLVKAISLAKTLYEAGDSYWPVATLLLGSGAVLFVVSDAVLSLTLFAGKNSRKMTVLNLSTYFGAQTLLAASIYFIR